MTGEMWKNKSPFRLAGEHCEHYTGRGLMTFTSLVQHLPEAWESPSRENSQGSGRRTVPRVSERQVLGRSSWQDDLREEVLP